MVPSNGINKATGHSTRCRVSQNSGDRGVSVATIVSLLVSGLAIFVFYIKFVPEGSCKFAYCLNNEQN